MIVMGEETGRTRRTNVYIVSEPIGEAGCNVFFFFPFLSLVTSCVDSLRPAQSQGGQHSRKFGFIPRYGRRGQSFSSSLIPRAGRHSDWFFFVLILPRYAILLY